MIGYNGNHCTLCDDCESFFALFFRSAELTARAAIKWTSHRKETTWGRVGFVGWLVHSMSARLPQHVLTSDIHKSSDLVIGAITRVAANHALRTLSLSLL